ncbi:NTF2 fold immunity protein [Flavobacterium aestivum]|uniref:NTF2 fold immunity protein n=1 Tax=Flavobacterium aestivum TaxID=3003257 RepID=UPI002285C416|nr:NTF2 fold immunity protein [Flavobacterium aestivum]
MDEEQVKKILIDFFIEMNKWETDSYSMLEQNSLDVNHVNETFAISKVGLQKIYDKYLTKKKRVYTTRDGSLGNPPAYNHLIENIKEVAIITKNRIVIETIKEDIIKFRNQYVFLKEGGEWKIDNKKTYRNHKEKFESTTI